MSSTIYFFVGEMGSGKSYCAKAFSDIQEIPWIEGDDYLSDAIKASVEKKELVRIQDVEAYVKDILAPRLIGLAQTHDSFVVSQALYFKLHRDWLKQELSSFDIDVVYVNVVSNFINHMKALASRKPSIYWLAQGLLSKPFFDSNSDHVLKNSRMESMLRSRLLDLKIAIEERK